MAGNIEASQYLRWAIGPHCLLIFHPQQKLNNSHNLIVIFLFYSLVALSFLKTFIPIASISIYDSDSLFIHSFEKSSSLSIRLDILLPAARITSRPISLHTRWLDRTMALLVELSKLSESYKPDP